jgi:hypothetical protein
MAEKSYELQIYHFIEDYFKEIGEIIDFHIKFFINNNIKTIDFNMLLLKKFIFQAFNFLKTTAEISFSRFLDKLYLDIYSLYNYLETFEKNSKLVNDLFENNFLPSLIEYRVLKEKIEKDDKYIKQSSFIISSLENEIKYFNPKTKNDIKELKRLKKRLVDAIHYTAKAKENISKHTIEINNLKNELKELFISEFKNSYNSYISKFKLIINTKLYYFNKQMWIEANQSQNLKKFGIDYLDLNLYIKNYLKHIDISKSKHYEEFLKIQDILKALNE